MSASTLSASTLSASTLSASTQTSFLETCATRIFVPKKQPVSLIEVKMYVGIAYADEMTAILTKNKQENELSPNERLEKMREDLINIQFQPNVAMALEHLLSLSDCTTAAFYEMAECVFEHMSECYFGDFKRSL